MKSTTRPSPQHKTESDMKTENQFISTREPVRCAVYARAGAQSQLGNNSAEQQIERCRNAARDKGWNVVEDCVRTDCGKSGLSMQGRSGLQELITLTATRPRPFDHIVCISTDRIARN